MGNVAGNGFQSAARADITKQELAFMEAIRDDERPFPRKKELAKKLGIDRDQARRLASDLAWPGRDFVDIKPCGHQAYMESDDTFTLTPKGCRELDRQKGIDPDRVDASLRGGIILTAAKGRDNKALMKDVYEANPRITRARMDEMANDLQRDGYIKKAVHTDSNNLIPTNFPYVELTPEGINKASELSAVMAKESSARTSSVRAMTPDEIANTGGATVIDLQKGAGYTAKCTCR